MPLSAVTPALLAARGLTDVDWTLTFATWILFLLFALVLGKFGWGPLLRIIEERERGVRTAIEEARKAQTEAQALFDQRKQALQEAARERDEMMKRTLKDAEQLKADLAARARTESDQMIQRARDQIDREKTLAIQELRAQVADLAVQAASRIVASSMSAEAQRKLVDEFVEQLPKLPSA